MPTGGVLTTRDSRLERFVDSGVFAFLRFSVWPTSSDFALSDKNGAASKVYDGQVEGGCEAQTSRNVSQQRLVSV